MCKRIGYAVLDADGNLIDLLWNCTSADAEEMREDTNEQIVRVGETASGKREYGI